jgi:ATP-binding cassette subfamily B protein
VITSRPKSALQTLGALAPFIAPYRTRIFIAVLALLVAAASTLALPWAFRELVDHGFSQINQAQQNSASVDRYFVGLFLVAIVLALGTAVRYYSVSWLGERVTSDLRSAVYGHVLQQDPRFFETLKTGEVLSRLTSDTTLIHTLVGTSISMGLRNTLLFLGAVVMMLITAWKLAAIIVLLIALIMVPLLLFGRKVRGLSRDSQDRLADANALAGERLNAIALVQAYAREVFEAKHYANASEQSFQAAIRRTRARAWLTVGAILLVFGAIVFVLWLGARQVMAGTMSPGVLTQFVLYAAMVAGSVGALSEVMGDIQRAAGATERLVELLGTRSSLQQGSVHRPLDSMTGEPIVRLDSVSFSYPSRPMEQALRDVSLQVKAGQTIALVGPSGAGKTTLFQLLLRYYDPQAGRIELSGQALAQWNLQALRESIGLVAQDNVVFSANALENIRYGKLEASDDEVVQAAREANAHEFIERLPQGYQTYLGERGVRLSGGQRQRIAIARALLKNPPLLLLDEATSALDAESEHLVQQALRNAMQGRTTLVIAHRLSTVIDADLIVVMDGGSIVERGSHTELLAANGLYARLARLQLS